MWTWIWSYSVPDCTPKSLYPEYKFSLVEQHAIDQEIEAFLEKQIIEQCEHEPEEIVFTIFLRPKKAVKLFTSLGFVVHPTKSIFNPTQSI